MAGIDYTPNVNEPSEPTNDKVARKGAEELRLIKALLASMVVANTAGAGERQTILSAAVDSSGYNEALTVGVGMRPGLNTNAGVDPYQLNYASGYLAGKTLDVVESIAADNVDILGVDLPVSNTSFIYKDYNAAYGSTLCPPQYGNVFDRTKGAILQCAGVAGSTTFLDDWGNTWTAAGGAKVQTNYFKFGTGAIGGAGVANALNGVADYVRTTDIRDFSTDSWTMRCWCKPLNALPGAGATTHVMSAVNVAGAGAQISIFNNGGTIRFAVYISSDGATQNIANGLQGTTLPVLNTEYYLELTFDALAGAYRLYVNGVQERVIASTARISGNFVGIAIGASATGGSNFFQGYVDKPQIIVGVCDHPAGTAYAVPTAAPSILEHKANYFCVPKMKMYEITGPSTVAATDPVLAAVTRLYLGEADTNAGLAITAIRNYAIRGQYIGPIQTTAVNTTYSFSSNLGVNPEFQIAEVLAKSPTTAGHWMTSAGRNASNASDPAAAPVSRNQAAFRTQANGMYFWDFNTTMITGTAPLARVRVRRSF